MPVAMGRSAPRSLSPGVAECRCVSSVTGADTGAPQAAGHYNFAWMSFQTAGESNSFSQNRRVVPIERGYQRRRRIGSWAMKTGSSTALVP